MSSTDVDDNNLEYHPFKTKRDERTVTRENALSEDEYERLLEGARRLDDLYDLEAELVILLSGRLGMRKGEIIHLQKSWIDLDEQVISIPRQDECDNGKDGGLCGYCKQLARQMADYNDIEYEEAASFFWKAKTEKAEREIPYDFDQQCVDIIETFFERFDEYYNSSSGLARRVDGALDAADGLSVDDTNPHGLRATAASHLVSLGLNAWSLQHFMGWAWPNTAQYYVRKDAKQLSSTLSQLSD